MDTLKGAANAAPFAYADLTERRIRVVTDGIFRNSYGYTMKNIYSLELKFFI